MSDLVKGRRVPWPEGLLQPGEYAFGPDGNWHGVTPTGHGANLGAHQVTEHEDGTITVWPSILVSSPRHPDEPMDVARRFPYQGEELWHGYLERGVWRSC